jgi:hypothetical protein
MTNNVISILIIFKSLKFVNFITFFNFSSDKVLKIFPI